MRSVSLKIILNFCIPVLINSYVNFAATDGQLGTRQVFVQVLKTEGVGGFFKGAVPVLARAFPANACCFMGYEAAMYAMKLMGI